MMLSAAWQQVSDDVAAYKDKDPDNRFVWKFSRQRLDFEANRAGCGLNFAHLLYGPAPADIG